MRNTILGLQKFVDLIINNILYRLKNNFFENDVSAFKWTCIVFSVPILAYFLFHIACSSFNICWWSSSLNTWEFIGFWTTITGTFLAFLVMLNINNKRTKTGSDFIQLISNELYSLTKGEVITIISPNMNIGSYLYKGESMFEIAIEKAINRGIKVRFITLGLDENYLSKCKKDDGGDIINSLKMGCTAANKSPQLKYIYDRYVKKIEEEEKNKILKRVRRTRETAISISSMTIDELYKLITNPNIEILVHCRSEQDFLEIGLVGFFTEKKLFIGTTQDVSAYKGKVQVIGETIELKKIIDDYTTQLVKKYEKIKLN